LPQGPERAGARLLGIAPHVIAGEDDVLPAQRRDVAEQVLVDRPALPAQLAIGSLQIPRVPEYDGRHQQVEPGGPKELVLEAAVAHLAEAAEVDGAGERVSGLALVEAEMGPARLVAPVTSPGFSEGE
jgi:hypothetical protein